MQQLSIRAGSDSRAGLKAENQDALMIRIPDDDDLHFKGICAVIADGVSRCARAALASRTCVSDFLSDYYSTPHSWTVEHSAARVLNALNQWLFNQGTHGGHEHDSLASTFAALILKSTTAHLLHVGDSRIYRLRDQQLVCMTRDHCSWQQGQKAYLTRAMGIDSHLEVDHRALELQAGDRFVLLTDGITEFLDDQQLLQLLASEHDDQACAEQILDQALTAGSDDNVTALVLTVTELPQQDIDEAHRALTRQVIPPVLSEGQRIDSYRVKTVLFNGTRSHLYLVADEAGEQYALKAPSAYFAEDPIYLDGFIREEWVGQKLAHPNLMRVHPRGTSAFLYHLCEYIPGISLRQWIHDHPSPSLMAVRQIMSQLIAALRALQRNQMVHRDLKPENVLITPDGTVKLIDFGTVFSAGWGEISSPLDQDSSVPVGSVHYIAPEYLLGQPATNRSDLFSLGMIGYEMLTGERPFKDTDFRLKRPDSFNAWQYRSARMLRKELPLWLDLALEKACAPNPRERYAAFSELEKDLSEPSATLLARRQSAPLIERNPLTFWKLISGILLLLVLAQGYLLLS